MNKLCHFCQGDSHKASDKPCQDYAYAESSESLSMAIVSDGHGGERYFRSQHGSRLAVEITSQAIRSFVENMPELTYTGKDRQSVFEGSTFTSYNSATATEKQVEGNAHKALQWLFSSIISQWNCAIARHAAENELDEWEKTHVEQKYIDEFLAKREQPDATYEKTYGCTLMAYAQTPGYWFAFQLGDGKCVSMCKGNNDELVCGQPIPWDEKCFLNKTTSLCDSNALEEFRYCYQGDGSFPLAMFLGSDGMDDSYGDGENLYNFYIQLFKIIARSGNEKARKELAKSLPIISQRGSKDDMSVSVIYDDSELSSVFFMMTDYQKARLEEQFEAAESKIMQLSEKIEGFGNPDNLDRSRQINLEYAKKDLDKAKQKAKLIKTKMSTLKCEVTKYRNRFLCNEPIDNVTGDSSEGLVFQQTEAEEQN